MLSIDTGYKNDREMVEESHDEALTNHNDNSTSAKSVSKIQMKSPTSRIHPYQHPTDPHKKKQQNAFVARTSAAATATVVSQEYSSPNKSHKKNSRTRRGSNESTGNSNAIVVSSFSNLASQSIEQGKYSQALEYYQLALQDYTKDTSKTTVVELVNAAATCFNLGALAKKLRDYPQAVQYFTQAKDIYRQSGMMVESFVQSGGVTVPISPSAASSGTSTSTSTYACEVCLLQLIVETLQAKAHLHYKYQSLVDDAIKCHEEVTELLEERSIDNDKRTLTEFQPLSLEYDVVYHKIHFTILPRSLRWKLLVTSLQALGKFYVEKGELGEAISAYQETLSVLKKLNEFQVESTLQRQEEISQILRALSNFFMQNHIESTDVTKLQRAALLQEDMENWEKAMQCWERVLYCQSNEHGDDSCEVSVTLGQLARVMVHEGNLEGALDLYQATANISLRNAQGQNDSKNKQSETKDCITFSIPEEIFSSILDIFHELGRVADAICWLKSLLSRSERREDQARIQLELGKLYLHKGFIHEASDSLYLSLELFDGEDESAFELLQQVEFLEKNDNHRSDMGGGLNYVSSLDARSNSIPHERSVEVEVDCLTAITEDGESALVTEGTSALTSSLGAALGDGNSKMVEEEDDNSSEDLSKIMSEIDEDDYHDPQVENMTVDESPSKTTNMQDETQNSLGESIENEKKDEGHSQLLSEGKTMNKVVNKENGHSYSENKTDSDLNRFLHETTIPYSTEHGDGEIISVNSNRLSPHKRIEQIDIEHCNFEPEPKHQTILSNSSPVDNINEETEESGKAQEHRRKFEFQESPIVHQNEIIQQSDTQDTPTTINSANSRTALLNPNGKPGTDQASLSLPNISSSPKGATDQRTSRGRKGYAEIKTSGKQSGATSRRRIVKALSSPFRRSQSKSRSTNSNPLVPLDEEKEVRQSMPTKKNHNKDPVEEDSSHSKEAPISYIDLRSSSDDERSLVSQLTFREYEMLSKKKEKQNENGHWWWGVTAEGLEGWFSSNYVNQAVEAAEGFLSAKSIHDRVKSRPLDFDSDEESEEVDEDEDESLLKDSFSKQSNTQGTTNDSSKNKLSKSKSLELSQQSRKPSLVSSAVKEVDESKSANSKTPCLESLIQERELELENTRKVNGPDDISIARLLFDLAKLYLKKKDSAVAMLYSRQAVKIQKSSLNLSEACKSLDFMAELHSREKRYKDALMCYSEVQRIHETLYGYFHEEIATDLNHCGHILARQGKFDLAMDKHKEALRILKDCCGENVKNPLVSETLIHIGAVYYKERNSLANIQSKQNDGYKTFIEGGMLEVIGRAHEDRGSYRMAIAFFEEKLQCLNVGENSKDLEDVAETLNSLGMLSCRAGMYLEAIDYYDRALGIQMKLGCDDVQLAMARVLAGSVQYSLGHFSKALKLFEDALVTLRQVGLEQETVAATLFHIGAVHAALCNYDDAMSNLRDALGIQTKLLGAEHPATFRTRREIGNLYAVYETEIDAAFDEYNAIIEAQRRVHGEKHPYVAETLHSIGCAQAKKGDLSGALRTLEDCYNMRLKFLGMDHPQQATTLHEIAKIQLKRGRLKKAIHIIDAALNIRVESLSEQHIDVALAMATKASCLVARVNFADANKLFMEALPIAKAAVGDMHPSVAWIQVQIGVMHLRKCDFEAARTSVEKAITIYRQSNLDDDHPGIKEAAEELERIERAEMLCV